MRRLNLTKHTIEKLAIPKDGRVEYHDNRVPGLGVMIRPTGGRVFFWYRRVKGRRTWKALGSFPDLSVEQARDKAQEINGTVAKWKAGDHEGPSPVEHTSEPLLSVVVESYIVKRLHGHAKNPERAEAELRWAINKHLPPLLKKRMGAIRRDDVRRLHDAIGEKHGHAAANRLITTLRAIFNWAIDHEIWVGVNPARKIALFPEHSRDRFLKAEEVPKFLQELGREPNRDLRDFIWLALMTGARRGDVLSACWEDISFDTRTWRIPNPKARVPYILPLMPEAIEVLKEREALINGSPWVFPGTGKTGHLAGVKRSWKAFLVRTKLPNFRIHDVRRTLGSWMAAGNESLPAIGKALGHQSINATAIYARMSIEPVRDDVTTATRALLAAGKKKPKRLPSVKPQEADQHT
jgi:integrase